MTELLGELPWYTVAVFFAFLLDWLAVALGWNRLKLFTKPLAMLLVILWTLTSFNFTLDLFVGLLVLAQVFGVMGDIFLLFPKQWFLIGLASFLTGHITYIALLFLILTESNAKGLAREFSLWMFLLGGSILVLLMAFFYKYLSPNLIGQKAKQKIWIAGQFYMFTLSGFMLLSCITAFLMTGETLTRFLLSLGGILFLMSDFMLVYDKFVRRIQLGQLWVRITYHLAQFSLAWGFVAMIEYVRMRG